MNDNLMNGINEQGLSQVILDIMNHNDKIAAVLDSIDTKVSELNNSLKGTIYNKYLSTYQEIKNQYPIIKENIDSYAQDLTALIRVLKETDQKVSIKFQEYTEETKQKAREIEII